MTAITNHSPKNIIVVNEDTQYKKPRKRDYIKSYFAGGTAQGVASAAVSLPSLLIMDKMTKAARGADGAVMKDALNQALDISLEMFGFGVDIICAKTDAEQVRRCYFRAAFFLKAVDTVDGIPPADRLVANFDFRGIFFL